MQASSIDISVFVRWSCARRCCCRRSPTPRRKSSAPCATNRAACFPASRSKPPSPAIIEKVRTAVTDDQGRYRIEALRPGIYKLTFSLTGFSTVVARERRRAVGSRHHHQRRHESRRARRNDHRLGRDAAGRRAVGVAHAGHHARRHRLAAGLAQRHVDRRAVAGRPPGHARRRRIAHDRAGRSSRARSRRRRRRAARRGHVDSESRGRVAGVLRRHAAVGNHDHDERDSRRHVGRRHPHEQRAEGRRQHVQRRGVPRLQQRQLAEREHGRRAARRSAQHQQPERDQAHSHVHGIAGRSYQARQDVVPGCGAASVVGRDHHRRAGADHRRPTAKSSTRISTRTSAALRFA